MMKFERDNGERFEKFERVSRMPSYDPKPTDIDSTSLSVLCITSLPISLGDIRTSTDNDAVLSELRKFVVNGFPCSREKLPECLRPFFCVQRLFFCSGRHCYER